MRSIKTLLFSALAFGTIMVSSCSKDNEEATVNATITANIDGTATAFNKNVGASTATVNGATITNIQGTDADGNNLSITVAGGLVAGKTYSSDATDNNDRPLIIYTAANSDSYVNDDSKASTIFKFTVAAASSNNASGAFSGGLTTIVLGNGAAKTKVITDGKFNVNLLVQ